MLLSMMALLRRSRVLAFALIFLAPGLSGSAVQWLHACPAQAAAAGHHRNHGQAPADAGHSQSCHCIGTCHTVGAASPAAAVTVAAAAVRPDYPVVQPSGISFIPVGTPSDLLPPATAPPLLS